MKIEVQLCPAHIPAVVESSSFKKKERVRDFLKKIDNMVNAGASLDDAMSYMGITSEKYKRYQKYLQWIWIILIFYCSRVTVTDLKL